MENPTKFKTLPKTVAVIDVPSDTSDIEGSELETNTEAIDLYSFTTGLNLTYSEEDNEEDFK